MLSWIRNVLVAGASPVMHSAGTHDPKLKAEHWYEIQKILRTGDVLVTRSNNSVTNSAIPGFYCHAAIYVGHDGESYRCVEATIPQVSNIDLLDLLWHVDHIAVLRPNLNSHSDRLQIAYEAKKLIGRLYDTAFLFGNDAYYCSEVVRDAILAVSEDYSSLFKTVNDPFGKALITPQSFYDHEDWECVYESPR